MATGFLDLIRIATAELVKVGPKGYVHGWIHVGVPGVGDHVFHPRHGDGKVTHLDEHGHVHVRFDSGKTRSFAHGTGTGHGLARRTGGDKFSEHLRAAGAANRRGDHTAAADHYRQAADAATHPKIKAEMLARAERDAGKTPGNPTVEKPPVPVAPKSKYDEHMAAARDAAKRGDIPTAVRHYQEAGVHAPSKIHRNVAVRERTALDNTGTPKALTADEHDAEAARHNAAAADLEAKAKNLPAGVGNANGAGQRGRAQAAMAADARAHRQEADRHTAAALALRPKPAVTVSHDPTLGSFKPQPWVHADSRLDLPDVDRNSPRSITGYPLSVGDEVSVGKKGERTYRGQDTRAKWTVTGVNQKTGNVSVVSQGSHAADGWVRGSRFGGGLQRRKPIQKEWPASEVHHEATVTDHEYRRVQNLGTGPNDEKIRSEYEGHPKAVRDALAARANEFSKEMYPDYANVAWTHALDEKNRRDMIQHALMTVPGADKMHVTYGRDEEGAHYYEVKDPTGTSGKRFRINPVVEHDAGGVYNQDKREWETFSANEVGGMNNRYAHRVSFAEAMNAGMNHDHTKVRANIDSPSARRRRADRGQKAPTMEPFTAAKRPLAAPAVEVPKPPTDHDLRVRQRLAQQRERAARDRKRMGLDAAKPVAEVPNAPSPDQVVPGGTHVRDLKDGQYARLIGTDQYGQHTVLEGYVSTPTAFRVGPKRGKKKDMLGVSMSETPSGHGANWRGQVFVPPTALTEKPTFGGKPAVPEDTGWVDLPKPVKDVTPPSTPPQPLPEAMAVRGSLDEQKAARDMNRARDRIYDAQKAGDKAAEAKAHARYAEAKTRHDAANAATRADSETRHAGDLHRERVEGDAERAVMAGDHANAAAKYRELAQSIRDDKGGYNVHRNVSAVNGRQWAVQHSDPNRRVSDGIFAGFKSRESAENAAGVMAESRAKEAERLATINDHAAASGNGEAARLRVSGNRKLGMSSMYTAERNGRDSHPIAGAMTDEELKNATDASDLVLMNRNPTIDRALSDKIRGHLDAESTRRGLPQNSVTRQLSEESATRRAERGATPEPAGVEKPKDVDQQERGVRRQAHLDAAHTALGNGDRAGASKEYDAAHLLSDSFGDRHAVRDDQIARMGLAMHPAAATQYLNHVTAHEMDGHPDKAAVEQLSRDIGAGKTTPDEARKTIRDMTDRHLPGSKEAITLSQVHDGLITGESRDNRSMFQIRNDAMINRRRAQAGLDRLPGHEYTGAPGVVPGATAAKPTGGLNFNDSGIQIAGPGGVQGGAANLEAGRKALAEGRIGDAHRHFGAARHAAADDATRAIIRDDQRKAVEADHARLDADAKVEAARVAAMHAANARRNTPVSKVDEHLAAADAKLRAGDRVGALNHLNIAAGHEKDAKARQAIIERQKTLGAELMGKKPPAVPPVEPKPVASSRAAEIAGKLRNVESRYQAHRIISSSGPGGSTPTMDHLGNVGRESGTGHVLASGIKKDKAIDRMADEAFRQAEESRAGTPMPHVVDASLNAGERSLASGDLTLAQHHVGEATARARNEADRKRIKNLGGRVETAQTQARADRDAAHRASLAEFDAKGQAAADAARAKFKPETITNPDLRAATEQHIENVRQDTTLQARMARGHSVAREADRAQTNVLRSQTDMSRIEGSRQLLSGTPSEGLIQGRATAIENADRDATAEAHRVATAAGADPATVETHRAALATHMGAANVAAVERNVADQRAKDLRFAGNNAYDPQVRRAFLAEADKSEADKVAAEQRRAAADVKAARARAELRFAAAPPKHVPAVVKPKKPRATPARPAAGRPYVEPSGLKPGAKVTWTHHYEDGSNGERTGRVWDAAPTSRGHDAAWVIPDERKPTDPYSALVVEQNKKTGKTTSHDVGTSHTGGLARSAATVAARHRAQRKSFPFQVAAMDAVIREVNAAYRRLITA